ncbi:uncharacterized protein LY89DRAFT_258857 [Mollisia scopiformis]|uniref:Uncharacterized protein n=1 Tax=Mollisia scopiformis TaxID=149040 RepID=A0A132BF84_MOLSC|nr:uncharacterized protein LY89DRAFT_258857 [Mollisia scopiformis]KUJ10367.1 hypothetical protein LY89DRAFT_258857 [Mollisia scopiformis]
MDGESGARGGEEEERSGSSTLCRGGSGCCLSRATARHGRVRERGERRINCTEGRGGERCFVWRAEATALLVGVADAIYFPYCYAGSGTLHLVCNSFRTAVFLFWACKYAAAALRARKISQLSHMMDGDCGELEEGQSTCIPDVILERKEGGTTAVPFGCFAERESDTKDYQSSWLCCEGVEHSLVIDDAHMLCDGIPYLCGRVRKGFAIEAQFWHVRVSTLEIDFIR